MCTRREWGPGPARDRDVSRRRPRVSCGWETGPLCDNKSAATGKTPDERPEPAAAAPADLLALDPTAPAVELTVTTLSKLDQALLRRTMRFLVNVLEPGLADQARREGYSRQEHELGWQLWRAAAGETRRFEHWLREQELVDGLDLDSDEQRRRLQEIDEFENTWFPRTRAIIRRVVKKDRRDAFAAAFFKDLVQQPLGPTVVGSVGTFLARLAGLETSTGPDAKAVRATLGTRGLTAGKLAAIAQIIEDTKTGVVGSPAKAPRCLPPSSRRAASPSSTPSRPWRLVE